MEDIIFSFEPHTRELNLFLYTGILFSVLGMIGFVYALKKNKKLLLLFSGFIGVIALGTAIFSGLTRERLITVQLYKNGITTPRGAVTFDKIKTIKLEELKEHSKYPVQRGGEFISIDTARVILVEEYDGKIHLISEENYPLDSIFNVLGLLVEQWREEHPPE